MTKYDLKEFKIWLEEDESRKAELSWAGVFSSMKDNGIEEWLTFPRDYLQSYRQVALKWKAEVDQREREREREQEESPPNMKCTKCQKEVGMNLNLIRPQNLQVCYDCFDKHERQQEETPNMVNAQDWLNEKFPTRESRERVKQLVITTSQGDHLIGTLDLSEFVNLEKAEIIAQKELYQIKGLENCPRLVILDIRSCHSQLQPLAFLAAWKQEIQTLKAQLAEYENQETASQTSTESSYSDLTTKIAQKKQELANLRDNTRKPTKHLRKEIELLEKIQALETQVSTLQAKETNYQEQIRQKEQQIAAKQSQITTLQSQATQNQRKITQLEKQLTDLQAEKAAIQEKMLQERQQALAEWEKEKQTLQTQITQLAEQKDTFQKSADYLRSTLKQTETERDQAQAEAKNAQENAQQSATNHQATFSQKDQELTKKQEAYSLIQERNTDLQAKLARAQEEVNKLTQWISKLEAASAEGDALQTLQKELAQAQSQVATLQEELNAKNPRKNYWWVYAIIALIALYFLLS